MRYLSIVFLFSVLFITPMPAAAGDKLTPRPLDAVASEAFERAQSRSSLVRSLVATLEDSNVIVHIVSSQSLPMGIGGTTSFVTSRGGYRYVRITISMELQKGARAAILGHELQHACEVAESGANNQEELRQVFEREGQRNGQFYETRAAVDAERHVRMQLQSARGLQAEPVVKFDH
jgi:hypothetical protein